jgi:hypothetical protein
VVFARPLARKNGSRGGPQKGTIMDLEDDGYDTPFGMLEYCLTVTIQQLIDEHVLGLLHLSNSLFRAGERRAA